MATNKKIERALRGPGLFEIIFGVILSVALGILLGAVHLALKPAVIVKEKELPKDAADNSIYRPVYYVEGSTDAAKGQQWKRKEQMLIEGQTGEISLSEEEINAFLAERFKERAPSLATAPTPVPGKPAATAPAVTPPRVNVRISESVLQFSMPTTTSLLGLDLSLFLQLRGGFVHGAEGFTFDPAEFYIGSLPIHRVPGLAGWLIKRMAAARPPPQELVASWRKVTNVALDGNTLKLTLP